jgi:hypothetical protein
MSAGIILEQLGHLGGQMRELILAWEAICGDRNDDPAVGSEDVANPLTESLALVEPMECPLAVCGCCR